MNLKDWLPEKDVDFFGMKISEDEKRGWERGRLSLSLWFSSLTFLERLKLAFKGTLPTSRLKGLNE